MRPLIVASAFAVIVHTTALAPAQPPLNPYSVPPPVMDPAYRHFLRSPYSYKAFSALRPGYSEQRVSPFAYDSFYVEPSRLHQRITPYGFESHNTLPGYGESSLTPWGYGGYYVPGYTQSYYLPVVRRR